MKKYDLYIGCNVDGKLAHNEDYVRFVCEKSLAVLGFDGATFTEAVDLWEGIEERTVICTICTYKSYKDVCNLARYIKKELNQESIMLIDSEPKIDFV